MFTFHVLSHALLVSTPSCSVLFDAPETIASDLQTFFPFHPPDYCFISSQTTRAIAGLHTLPKSTIVLSQTSLASPLPFPVAYHASPVSFIISLPETTVAYCPSGLSPQPVDLMIMPGHDFASLSLDHQTFLTLHAGSSFTYPPFRALEVSLADITPQSVKTMSDNQLLDAHRILHRAWANFLAGHHYNREDLVNSHIIVYQEMLARGMEHGIVSSLDLETQRLLRSIPRSLESKSPLYTDLDEFVWIEDFISLSGSTINYSIAKDLDIIIRGDLDLSDPRKPYLRLPFVPLRIKLERLLPPEHRPALHYVDEPTGPNWSYQPLFRLVLQPVEPTIRHIPDRFQFYGTSPATGRMLEAVTPMVPFTPMKAQAAYHVGEFFDTEELYELWAKPLLDENRPIAVQIKYDGIRMLVHKQDSKVAIYTEDKKRDRASVLPHIVKAIQAIPAKSVILDTEFVIWEDGAPIPRHKMVGLVTAKEPYTEKTDIRVNVHDCLYLNGQDLTEAPYGERLEALEEVLPKANPPLYPAPTQVATDKPSLDKAVAWASKQPGSEGAMLKTVDSPYETKGLTPRSHLWAKFKLIREAKVQVIGVYTKPLPWQAAGLTPPKEPLTGKAALDAFRTLLAGSQTFIYRCAYLQDGKLVPLRAKGVVTPADIQLRWVVKGTKDPLTGQVASSSQWRGSSDPAVWTMAAGVPHEVPGDVPYAATYATAIEAHLGDIITVQPVRFDSFIGADGKTHYSWTFPRVRNLDPERDKPDTLQDIQRLARATASHASRPLVVDDLVTPERFIFTPLVRAREVLLDPETIEALPKRERQRIELEKAIGDWYMLEQPEDGPRQFTVQYHVRGIWHSDALDDLQDALRSAPSPSALARIWKDYDLAIVTDLPALKAAAQKADDEKGDVIASIAKFLDTTTPAPSQLQDLWPRLVNQGNVHVDWRFQMPDKDALFGWTLDTPKSVLQFLKDGRIEYLLRDRFLDNQEGDNILAQKKAMQPLAWFTLVTKSKPTYEAEPATVGATPETAGLFIFQDSGRFLLLTQKSDYHEYAVKFEKHTALSGRWGLQLLPPHEEYEKAPKWPWWMLNRPAKTQAPYILTHSRKTEEAKARKEKVDVIWNAHALELLQDFLPHMLEGFTKEQVAEKVKEFS